MKRMSNNSNDFIKALHTIREFCLSINCEDCPLFSENGLSVCEFKPYLWVDIPSPLEDKKEEGEQNDSRKW